jgi:hypothetical protein
VTVLLKGNEGGNHFSFSAPFDLIRRTVSSLIAKNDLNLCEMRVEVVFLKMYSLVYESIGCWTQRYSLILSNKRFSISLVEDKSYIIQNIIMFNINYSNIVV